MAARDRRRVAMSAAPEVPSRRAGRGGRREPAAPGLSARGGCLVQAGASGVAERLPPVVAARPAVVESQGPEALPAAEVPPGWQGREGRAERLEAGEHRARVAAAAVRLEATERRVRQGAAVPRAAERAAPPPAGWARAGRVTRWAGAAAWQGAPARHRRQIPSI